MDKEQLLKLNQRIKDLEKSLDEKTKEYKELNAKYLHLKARYQNMSDELILLKEGVVNETINDRTSKRRN
jgi:N-dimethylarginine dimethylaminohydrolase